MNPFRIMERDSEVVIHEREETKRAALREKEETKRVALKERDSAGYFVKMFAIVAVSIVTGLTSYRIVELRKPQPAPVCKDQLWDMRNFTKAVCDMPGMNSEVVKTGDLTFLSCTCGAKK